MNSGRSSVVELLGGTVAVAKVLTDLMLLPRIATLFLSAGLVLAARLGVAQTCALQAPAFAGHTFPEQGSPLDGDDFQIVNAFPGLSFNRPLFLTFAPDGTDRLFVIEQAGRIRVFPNNPSATTTSLFLDITSLVQSAESEQGLLGLAFHPGYASNGFFYVNYTAHASTCIGSGPCVKIVRYRVSTGNPDQADPVSAFELLQLAHPDDDHNGGMLAFGPDGMLYIASGDGGDNGDPNGQDLTNRLGKILRIDPGSAAPYIPADNPFAGDATKAREIWHYGLRNPWRFSFDRLTGDLWIGDVGQNAWEEIDFFPAGHAGGANLGWSVCEGNHDYAGNCAALGATAPVFEYSHGSGMGVVVVGGYVYRGSASPGLTGAYIFGDAGSGRIFAWDGVSPPVDVGSVPEPGSFGEDEQGEIYALDLASGSIQRIVHSPGGGGGNGFPVLLSQTGLFSNVANLTPASGMIEYSVAVPFWSDNASKRRWIALPAGSRIGFDADDAWDPPEGTALVKHFEVPTGSGQTRRLETRVLLNQPSSQSMPARWVGLTYRWNLSQTDAELLTAGLDEQITINVGAGSQPQTYHYPAPWECLQCHNSKAGDVLGLRTAQMNRGYAYPGGTANQLTTWFCAGMLDEDPHDPAGHETLVDPANTAAGLTPRARSWLDVNCSMCHRPAGLAPGGLDLRRYPLLGNMNVIGVPPSEGNLGLVDPRRIFAGRKEQSVLWARVQNAQAGVHMPPQSRAADPLAVSLLGQWIDTGLFVLDSDADGSSDAADNCPYVANNQSDVGGIGLISLPDGIGNACQCGDLWNDGRVTSVDPVLLRRSLAASPLPSELARCNVFDAPGGPKGDCDLADVAVISRALSGASPGIGQLCRAAGAVP